VVVNTLNDDLTKFLDTGTRTVCERVMQLATFDLRDLNAGFLTFPVVDLVKNTSAITFGILRRHAVASLDLCQIEIWTELSASQRRKRYRYAVCWHFRRVGIIITIPSQKFITILFGWKRLSSNVICIILDTVFDQQVTCVTSASACACQSLLHRWSTGRPCVYL